MGLAAPLGCADEPKPASKPRVIKREKKEKPVVERIRYYDDKGMLLPSETAVAGLILPVGLQLHTKSERKQIFRMTREVPFEKLVAYFGPRLFTGQVDARSHEVAYLKAVPNDQLDSLIKLDVRISRRVEGITEVAIKQYPRNFATPPTTAQAQQALKEALRRQE